MREKFGGKDIIDYVNYACEQSLTPSHFKSEHVSSTISGRINLKLFFYILFFFHSLFLAYNTKF